jgi:oligopeptide/dipeptide ABC transporter ATP-binding protein
VPALLAIDNLSVRYHERTRVVRAVDALSLSVDRGRALAIVGESGCGKTTLALAILGLLPDNAQVSGGAISFDGSDLRQAPAEDVRRLRGRVISMIFQDAVSGLNPVLTIGTQVEEIVRTHLDVPKRESRAMTLEALRRQGLSEPERLMAAYPFQLSGGMCQRVMIAIATVLRPALIIADEPTSSVDVTVQAAILRQLEDLRSEMGTTILLITHNLGVVARIADDVAVMYAGRIVEQAPAQEIYESPSHPYTSMLMAARPRLDSEHRPLQQIKGTPPDLAALTGECAFLPRCPKAVTACRTDAWPPLSEQAPAHLAACYNPMFRG